MSTRKRKKCRHCRELFTPDARNATRQNYCSKPECRKTSKSASQKRWLEKDENRDYFCGSDNVKRVRRWRKAHPGYWRRARKQPDALQDLLMEQHTVNTDDNSDFVHDALQDSLIMQPSVIVGIIAHFTGCALQDDIAMATRRMQQLGDDILNLQCKGGRHGLQASVVPGKGPKNPQAIQLARSPTGARPSH